MTEKLNEVYDNIGKDMFQRVDLNQNESEKMGYSNYSYWNSTMKLFLSKRLTVILISVLSILLLVSIIQPYLPNQKDPLKINISEETGRQDKNQPPSSEYWVGTNAIGQDLWARIWSGTRTSLFVGVVVGLFEAFFGILVGALWGYIRSIDRTMTEIYNILSNIPNTIIMVLMSYILKPSMSTLIIAMCITGWLPMARFVRNQIVIIRDREYNLASLCLGTPVKRMITKNLLPYLVSVIMLRVALSIPAAIGYEVFLTYIGLGLPVSIPSLGNLINDGRGVIMSATLRYQLIYPAIVMGIITISFYMLGNAFADAADPKNHV